MRMDLSETAAAAGLDTSVLRKARGAFFTPPELCSYVARWAIRSSTDTVLEPSCGDAQFLLAAGLRLRQLGDDASSGDSDAPDAQLSGVELHERSARTARIRLADEGIPADVQVMSFFDVMPTPRFSAVIGNPPYVRYQGHTGEDRVRSRAAALRAGVRLTGLASTWAAFTVHSALFLRDGGRLGLVLPAELLSTNYAAQVRRFLMERFASVGLVLFEQRVFPDVQEEVVLLLADGYSQGPTDHCVLRQVADVASLVGDGVQTRWSPVLPEDKWTPSLLSGESLAALASVSTHDGFTTLHGWGETSLGAVTGNNGFFMLSAGQARELGLQAEELTAMSPPGSRHLRGLAFTTEAWTNLTAAGAKGWLFRPSKAAPSVGARRLITDGERLGVDRAYKCQIRTPWWRVPVLAPPDLFLTYMNADTPRLSTNRAGVRHLNSVHGVYLHERLRQLGQDLLALASVNSLTLLAAETVGRAYGGGMLKIEPREADRLPVPAPALLEFNRTELTAVRPDVEELLRAGNLLAAASRVDEVLLTGAMGVTPREVGALRVARAHLADRRRARGRRS